MPYNFFTDSFYTQKNFVADFIQAKCDFTRKMAVLRFRAPWGLGQGMMIILGSLESAKWTSC